MCRLCDEDAMYGHLGGNPIVTRPMSRNAREGKYAGKRGGHHTRMSWFRATYYGVVSLKDMKGQS